MSLKNCSRNKNDTENRRPELNEDMKAQDLLKWYWLKEELIAFCRNNALSVQGNKKELCERIYTFLEKGKKTAKKQSRRRVIDKREELSLDSKIEDDLVCSQRHREFFRKYLGRSFAFNVSFQNWLKNNTGKTYADAIKAYEQIKKDSKTEKKEIGAQFEYNTYIRDFFAANSGYSLNEAIRCWKYKKSLPGDHHYGPEDLQILKKK